MTSPLLTVAGDVVFESFLEPPPDDSLINYQTMDRFLDIAETFRAPPVTIPVPTVITAATHPSLPGSLKM